MKKGLNVIDTLLMKSKIRVVVKKVVLKLITPVGRIMYPYKPFNDIYKVIFVHIPKNAGTSVLSLLENSNSVYQTHVTYREFYSADRARFEKYSKFCITRNPYDRLVSAYHYLKQGGDQQGDLIYRDNERDRFASFEVFVKSLTYDDVFGLTVLNPQWIYVYSLEYEKIMVDEIFKIEDLSKFDDYLNSRGVVKSLLTKNKSVRNVWKDYYSRELYEIVNKIYSKDFDLFGYEKNQ
jgi:hypothetical protein